MRMVHYYAGLASLVPPSLLAALVSGIAAPGSRLHVVCGLFTSLYCVAVHTLLILFMIVTGRILKAAMRSRPLGSEFLAELNAFFARKRAYPLALLASLATTVTAVLGYGPAIGVPAWVHALTGVVATLINLWALGEGYRTLSENQSLVDRVAAALDRLDAEAAAGRIALPRDEDVGWRVGHRARWLIFAASAWLPYLYWGLIVWRADFARVPAALPVLSATASLLCLVRALRAPAA